jgi:phosphopantothenoylcysteine decarboxylase/phosphopantothenate--cysteine ligase
MGYELAKAARDRGAEVLLISGPSSLPQPAGVGRVLVETAAEMLAEVQHAVEGGVSILIMAAAVADFAPAERAAAKREKSDLRALELRQTPDIISTVAAASQRPFIVGFAAETSEDTARASLKMARKGMDMIVFNNVSEPGAGFDGDTNRVVIIDPTGQRSHPLMSKTGVAHAVLDRLLEIKS